MNVSRKTRFLLVTAACTFCLLGGTATSVYSSTDLRGTLGPVAVAGFKACTPSEVGVSYNGITVSANRQDEECEQFEVWDDGAYKIKLWCRYLKRMSNPWPLGGDITVFDSHLRVTIDGNLRQGGPNVTIDVGQLGGVINTGALRNSIANLVLKDIIPRIGKPNDGHINSLTDGQVIALECMGHVEVAAHKYLEGVTTDPNGLVRLQPDYHFPYTGARWKVHDIGEGMIQGLRTRFLSDLGQYS